MSRRPIPPRRVEALARECKALRSWLLSPAGASADPDAFALVLRAYQALGSAVSLMPRGPQCLARLKALPRRRSSEPDPAILRDQDTYTPDETVALDAPVLTRQGWLVPVPLVSHVDAELKKLDQEREHSGPKATDTEVLTEILRHLARKRNQSEVATIRRELPKLKTRLSRARSLVRKTHNDTGHDRKAHERRAAELRTLDTESRTRLENEQEESRAKRNTRLRQEVEALMKTVAYRDPKHLEHAAISARVKTLHKTVHKVRFEEVEDAPLSRPRVTAGSSKVPPKDGCA